MKAEESQTGKGGPDNELAMSRMKEEIEAIAKEEANQKIKEAEVRADEIITEAKREAEGIKRQIISKAKDEARKKKIREVSRKKLNLKMDYLETRESIIDEITVEARSELQKFTKSTDYPQFLSKLVKSSGVSMGGGNIILHLRTEDKSHFTQDSLNSLSKEIGEITGQDTSLSVADEDLDALGGIRLVRSDNDLYVDNTFERRLERSEEDIRVALLDVLS